MEHWQNSGTEHEQVRTSGEGTDDAQSRPPPGQPIEGYPTEHTGAYQRPFPQGLWETSGFLVLTSLKMI